MFKNWKDIENCFDEYPEVEFTLLELKYTPDDLIRFIKLNDICSIKDFNIEEFKEFLFSKNLSKNQTRISCVMAPNPNIGDLAVDNETGNIVIFNGVDWVAIM